MYLSGDTANNAQIAWCLPYYAWIAEYNAHRIVYINPIPAEIRSIRSLALKIDNSNCIAVDWDTVNIVLTGWCALYYSSNAECNAHRDVYINPIAAEIRTIRSLTLKWKNVIALQLSGDTVNKAQIAWCRPYYASYAEYKAHRIVYINTTTADLRSIRSLTLKWKNVIALQLSGDTVNKAQIAWCRPYYVSTAEYNAHRIVYINPIAAEIRSIRFLTLKIAKCNCIAFDWGHR
jgi:protein subunit release factor B